MEQPALRRTLGLFDVVLFFVVAGSNLQWVAAAAAAGPSSLPIWLIGGATMFLPLSLAVIYLSSHYPEEGGLYAWSKRAFGPFAGFITGWTYWTSNLPYFPALLYFAAGNALYVGGNAGGSLSASPLYFIAVAMFGLALATIVNIYGLQIGKWLNNAGAVSRWVVTLLLIGLGAVAWWKFGSATPITAATMRPGIQLKDVIFWSVIAFAWTGPEAMSFMAGEIRKPQRNVPLGLALAAPAIAVIYVIGTASVLWTLAPSAVNPSSGVMQSIGHAASRFGWTALTPIAAILVALSCFGSTGAWLGTVARIPFVAGIDRYLPPAFGRMHPRWGSPVVAILTQACIAAVFIVLGQSGSSVKDAYQELVSETVLITMIPFAFLFASVFKLHATGATPNPVRIPGGRWTVVVAAAIGLATTLIAMAFAAVPSADDAHKTLALIKVIGMTVVLVLIGATIYWLGRRRAGA